MYQEDKDDTTRVGLWITFGVVTLVVISIVGAMVVRQLKSAAPAAAPATVAAAPGATVAVVEELVLIEGPLVGELVSTLFFEVGQTALPAGASAELDKVVQGLAAAPARKLVISGFHDASGDPAVNAEVAKQRALSAHGALAAAGIDRARIALRKPEVTTGSGTDQEARRVELRLVE